MRNLFVAISLAALWIVLLTLGLSAQSDLPDLPELPDSPHQVQFTIPPFEPPDGTVITVTTTSDDLEDNGNCTLREAIQAANTDTAVDGCPAGDGEDLIVLAAGVYVLSIAGSSEDDNATGDLDIRSSLVVSGTGAEMTVVDANGIDRVLHVHEGTRVKLRGLTLRNGQPAVGEPGGGLYNLGTFTLTNSIVANNFAGDSIYYDYYTGGIAGGAGGGIANEGVMVVVGSTVIENANTTEPEWSISYGSGGDGGGIFNSGTLSVVHSHVLSNTAGHGADNRSSSGYPGGYGGGIFNSGDLSIFSSVISGNQTGQGGAGNKGNRAPGLGGGIANSGTVTVTHSQLKANIGRGGGGGLHNTGRALLITNNIEGNSTTGRFGDGGGIFNTNYLRVYGTTIQGNRCGNTGRGGGLSNRGMLFVSHSTISGNRSGDSGYGYAGIGIPGGDGGGIYNQGSLFLENSTIVDNVTGAGGDYEICYLNPSPYPGSCKSGMGGGIANAGGAVSIHNSIIAQNTASVAAIGPDCLGSINSYGYNLIGTTNDCTLVGAVNHDLYNQPPWLASLADNGGPTPTHALLPQSPALNAGSCISFDGAPLTEDQRDEPRPQGDGCDIGAYESDLEYVPPDTLFLPVIGKNNE